MLLQLLLLQLLLLRPLPHRSPLLLPLMQLQLLLLPQLWCQLTLRSSRPHTLLDPTKPIPRPKYWLVVLKTVPVYFSNVRMKSYLKCKWSNQIKCFTTHMSRSTQSFFIFYI
ncbi:unnamed protein product [Nippostrongylus brasiliensis]|uniref:Secreted protein n=1 Tax=Nippostrongylus brasiliensis TaxID=27835 RepID=A0A0N4YGE3_NIPBR|nr:unnamed protein product [Nippostrongylus brasiliensis]